MALSPGTRLGPYEILAPLGAGGMGEVWRATDTRLGREVAVKVLPDDVASDARALSRFESEARAVAALSHPNILALFDVGESGGIHYAVTELLQGQTLRLALSGGPLTVRRALDVAVQIADALAAAHENGILHRDVKPENVFLGPDGRVKLLDFGLARQASHREPDDTRSPTVTDLSTPGSVAGTVAYMSPEQARGERADFRSDQFSLGIVLYEMLAGLRPFRGDSAAETLTAIIREEPEPLEKSAPGVPPPLRWSVGRCLAKEPGERYDSTRDLARELATCRAHLSETTSGGAVSPPLPPSRVFLKRILAALAATGVLAAIAALTLLLVPRPKFSGPIPRFDIELPAGWRLDAEGLDVSPDGQRIVFGAFRWKIPYESWADSGLFVRPMDSLEATPLKGGEHGYTPAFSPDGRWIAFTSGDDEGGRPKIRRVPAEGGIPENLCQLGGVNGLAWLGNDSVLIGRLGPLVRVPATGGTPEAITELDTATGEMAHVLPHVLPDGRTVIYTALRYATEGLTRWDKTRIWAQRLGSKERSLLVEGGTDGRWAPPGILLFGRNGVLMGARLDESTLRLTGQPVPLVAGVSHAIMTPRRGAQQGAVNVTTTRDGALVYAPGSVSSEVEQALVWVDEKGHETPIDAPRQSYSSVAVSPDGGQILYARNYPGKQVEILDLGRGSRRQVTFEGSHTWAAWGPGPDRITFTSDHEGPLALYTRKLDAPPDQTERLWVDTSSGRVAFRPWSRDGQALVFSARGQETGMDVWALSRGGEARPLLATRFGEREAVVSPDGKWFAYHSNEQGQPRILLRSLDGAGPVLTVTTAGGNFPIWARDGGAIFFKMRTCTTACTASVYRVRLVPTQAGFEVGKEEKLFEGDYASMRTGGALAWDVAPDGRLLLTKPHSEFDDKAHWDTVFATRIRVDLGGVERMMLRAEKRP